MKPQCQHQRSARASQPPATQGSTAAANTSLLYAFAFTCLVCLSLQSSILISLPR